MGCLARKVSTSHHMVECCPPAFQPNIRKAASLVNSKVSQLSSLKACIMGSSKVFLPSSNKSMEEYHSRRHQPIRLLRQEVCRKWVPCQVVINRPCTDSFDFRLCHASLRA